MLNFREGNCLKCLLSACIAAGGIIDLISDFYFSITSDTSKLLDKKKINTERKLKLYQGPINKANAALCVCELERQSSTLKEYAGKNVSEIV